MKKYRIFSVDDISAKLKGIIELRMDDEDRYILKKLKEFGMNLSNRKYYIDWGDDTYLEIIDKKTYHTKAFLEQIR